MLEQAAAPTRPACSGGWPTSPTTSSATPTPPRTRACKGRVVGGHRRRAGHGAVRHADRHRGGRRPAHGPVADPARRRRRVVGAAPARCGPTTGPCSAAPTPAPTSTACAARPYTTRFLGDTLRGRKLVSLERAVQLITDVPARLFGLQDRGRVAEGGHADLVVFDPETVGAEHATLVHDLPGDTPRLTAAVPRRRPRVRQRRGRGRRRRGHRRPPRHGPALRPRHRNRQHGLI